MDPKSSTSPTMVTWLDFCVIIVSVNTKLIIKLIIVCIISGIFGYYLNGFLYLDRCLDAGGGMNPGGHRICVVEKEIVKEKTIFEASAIDAAVGIKAVGTEPFWGFTFKNGVVKWSEPGEKEVVHITIPATTDGTRGLFVLSGDGFKAFAREESCSDGMSGIPHTHSVLVKKGFMMYSGCVDIVE